MLRSKLPSRRACKHDNEMMPPKVQKEKNFTWEPWGIGATLLVLAMAALIGGETQLITAPGDNRSLTYYHHVQ